MLEITPEHIAELADDDLRTLVGLLCESQLRRLGLPTSAVTYGGDQNAADGGLDVVVRLPVSTSIHGFVPRPITGFQVKSTDMPRCEILKEISPDGAIRPVIQELAEQSGAYIIVSSQGSVSDTALRSRQKAMRDAIDGIQHASSLRLDFYDRTRLATWVRDYPGLIPWVREKIGKAIPGWRSYGAWANPSESESAKYLIDDKVRIQTNKMEAAKGLSVLEGIGRIREPLHSPGTVVRLVGLSGVGKTRLVQALFDERIGGQALDPSLAVYTNMADDPNPQPVGLASDLLAERARAILVVDNCPPKLHRRLSEVCRSQGSTLSVLTIEYDIREDESEETEVFKLQPSSIELIEQLIRVRFPAVSAVDAHTIAVFSGGNALIAIALASTIPRGGTIVGLKDEDLFNRLFQQRHEHDRPLLIAAQACSLVYSFQGDDIASDDAELPRLGALIGQSAEELFRHVAELHSRDLLQQRGVWRAVLPHAIANRLAAMALEKIPFGVIEAQLVNDAPERLLRSFSRRLGYLHDRNDAVRVVEKWLGIDGLLGDLARLNDLGKAMLNNVAPAAPGAVLAALERALNDGLSDQLLLDLTDYSDLLRSIAYDPDLFDRSVALLIKLSDVEKDDDIYHHASNAFQSLFYIYLSGTHAPIEQRLRIIEELLKSDDLKRRELGLKALGATMEAWHFRSSHSFEFGGQSRNFGYSPNTIAETQHWYSTVLGLVETLACSDSLIAPQVCATLAKNFRSLWTKAGVYDDLDRISRAISAKQDWRDGWHAIRLTLKFNSERFARETKSRLTSLERFLQPKDLVQKVRFIVLSTKGGALDLSNFEDDAPCNTVTGSKSERRTAVAEGLGKEAARNDQAFAELLPELFSSGGQLFSFGRGLAKGTRHPKATWRVLVAELGVTSKEKNDVQVLRGYLNALKERDTGLSDNFLDDAVEDSVLAYWFPLLQIAIPIEKTGIIRLKRSLAFDRAPIWMFQNLAFGAYLDTISGKNLKELILLIAAKPNGYDAALEILAMRLFADNQDKREHDAEVIEAGQELMRQLIFRQNHKQDDYKLGEIAKTCLTGKNGASIAQHTCLMLKQAVSSHEAYGYEYLHLISSLLKVQPASILNTLFAGSDDAERQQGIRVINDISEHHMGDPLDAVLENDLFKWCDKDPVVRYPTIASVIRIFHKADEKTPLQWTALAHRVLKKAPDRLAVLEKFVKRCRPLSWSGSLATIMEERARLLGQLETYSDSLVVEFIATEQACLRQEIERERKLETAHDRATDERFE